MVDNMIYPLSWKDVDVLGEVIFFFIKKIFIILK